MISVVLAALSWEPQVKGALYVFTAVVILVGSAYLLLATNVGARLGFMLASAGLFGFLTTIGIVWWVYGIGPKGPEPKWDVVGVIAGDLSSSANKAVAGFPRDWEKLDVADKEVADAQPVVDGSLVGPGKQFQSAGEFLPVGAYAKGGETFGPLGIDVRPFDVFHKPHYLVVQVQRAKKAPTAAAQPAAGAPAEGQPAAAQPAAGQPAASPPAAAQPAEGAAASGPEPDPTAPVVTVVMLRDLGARRLNPAVFTISSSLLFGLFCYQLHIRDKRLAEERERGVERPQPVLR